MSQQPIRTADRPPAVPATATRAVAIGAAALGALAIGAVAIGFFAIGRLVVGRLVVGETRFRRVEIDDLTVRRLRVLEPTPRHERETRT